MSPTLKEYAEAFEFLGFWYQARPYTPRTGGPEEIAIRAVLDQQPQFIQCVKRQLKALLGDRRFGRRVVRDFWALDDDDDARKWVVGVIRGLSQGQRLRDQTGRVALLEPIDLSALGPPRRSKPRAEPRRSRGPRRGLMAEDDPVR